MRRTEPPGGLPARADDRAPVPSAPMPPVTWLQVLGRPLAVAAVALNAAAAIALAGGLPLVGALAAESELARVARSDHLTLQRAPVADADAFFAFRREGDGRVAAHAPDLVRAADFATLGPLYLADVNGGQPAGAVRDLKMSATYMDHLAAHVEVVEGQLPPEGLAGRETAVSMSMAGADQAGLRLSDRFCLDVQSASPRQPRWCARLIALWRPVDAGDPYWAGTPSRGQLFLGRFDLFELAQARPELAVTAGLRYVLDTRTLGPERAEVAARGVNELRREGAAQPGTRVTTGLDAALDGFANRERAASRALTLVAAGAALGTLLLMVLLAGHLARRQPTPAPGGGGRLAPAAAAGVGTALLVAVAVGAALLAAALGLGGLGLAGPGPRPHGLVLAAGVAALGAAGLALALTWLPVHAGVDAPEDGRPPAMGPRALLALTLAAAALLTLASARLLAEGRGDAAGVELAAVLAALAAGLAAAAGSCLLPIGLRRVVGSRRDVAGMFASRQLERQPDQHALVAVLLALGSALAVVAAFAAASRLGLGRTPSGPLDAGLLAGLLLGFGAVQAVIAAGLGLHRTGIAGRRLEEATALFASGLPGQTLADGLAAELAFVRWAGLGTGAVAGAAAALAVPAAGLAPASLAAGAIGAAAGWLVTCAVALAAARRRERGAVEPPEG